MPFDVPQTVTIRKLTGREIEKAQAEHAVSIASGRGWGQKIQRILSANDSALVEKELNDPLLGYDRHTVIVSGLIGWSYTEHKKPKPVTAEAAADLDDEAAEFIARAIMRLTKPALFAQTAEAIAVDQKNG